MAEAAKIQNPNIRKMTSDLIEAHYTEQIRAKQQDVAQAFMDASQLMNQPQNKESLQNGKPLEAVLPPSLLDRVAASPEHLSALRAMSFDRQASDPDATLQMTRLISDKAALGAMDISDVMAKVGGRLNSSDRASLRKEWESAHEARLRNASTPVPNAEVDRAVEGALTTWQRSGYSWLTDSSPWTDVNSSKPFEKGLPKLQGEWRDRYVRFRNEAYRLAQIEKDTKGRPLGTDEIQNVIDKALHQQVEIYNPVLGETAAKIGLNKSYGKLPYAMMLEGERVRSGTFMTGKPEDISQKDLADMVSLINDVKGSNLDWRTIPVNDARIQRMWIAFRGGNKDLVTRIASE
jgi:hypothetical protein